MINRFFDKGFHYIIAFVCLAYTVLEIIYVNGLPLVMDEFQGARAVNRLASAIPYRDFMPYKTVLGYYIQLIPLSLPGDIWSKLMYVKWGMVLINSTAIFTAAEMLAKHFRRGAVVLATLSLICMSTFIERSGALRVDMLTSWFGLFSLLFMFERRMVIAGLLLACSFLTSQKGVYFAASSGLALSTYWLFACPDRRTFREMLLFASAALVPIGLYFGVFGLMKKSVADVTSHVVVAHKAIIFNDMYKEILKYWFQTVTRNPFFYGVTVLAIGNLFSQRRKNYLKWTLGVYGMVLFACCLWHKQPWPYFFLLLIPTGFVLASSLFHNEIDKSNRLSIPLLIVFAALAIGYPLQRVPVVFDRDNNGQRNTIQVAEKILEEGDSYLAGVAMIFTHEQTKGLEWLDRAALNRLRRQNANQLIRRFKDSPPKILIMNYRLRSLPRGAYRYLANNYRHFHGNVHIYCPSIAASARHFDLGYRGNYRILFSAKPASKTMIDSREVRSGTVHLEKGKHTLDAQTNFRLCLQPDGLQDVADPIHKSQIAIFPEPYSY